MTTRTETKRCPFPDCDFEVEFNPDEYHEDLDADFKAERHYEREHGGKVKVKVTVEMEQILGGRDPSEVADHFHDKVDEGLSGWDVAYAVAEVLEEADDHTEVN